MFSSFPTFSPRPNESRRIYTDVDQIWQYQSRNYFPSQTKFTQERRLVKLKRQKGQKLGTKVIFLHKLNK